MTWSLPGLCPTGFGPGRRDGRGTSVALSHTRLCRQRSTQIPEGSDSQGDEVNLVREVDNRLGVEAAFTGLIRTALSGAT